MQTVMHICTYIYILHTYIHTYIYIYIYIYTRTCIHTYINACTYAHAICISVMYALTVMYQGYKLDAIEPRQYMIYLTK